MNDWTKETRTCRCGATFTPKKSWQVHCETKCRIQAFWSEHKVVKKGSTTDSLLSLMVDLDQAVTEIECYVDVKDGPEGQQQPNRAMEAQRLIMSAMRTAKGLMNKENE